MDWDFPYVAQLVIGLGGGIVLAVLVLLLIAHIHQKITGN